MKPFFVEKSYKKTFLTMITSISLSSFLLQSCQQTDQIMSQVNDWTNFNALTSKNISDKPVKQVNNNKRIIYITFDDGPNNGTANLIKIINKHKIYATSFVIGSHTIGSYKQKRDFDILKKDTLIELANHSFGHAKNKYTSYYKSPFDVVNDFKKVQDSQGLKTNIARTPGRNIWRLNGINITDIKSSKASADALSDAGFKLVGWDLEWESTSKMKLRGNHKQMLKKVDSLFYNDLEQTSRHLVILTHDQYLADVESANQLDLFIKKLVETNRFEFKKISDYPNIKQILN